MRGSLASTELDQVVEEEQLYYELLTGDYTSVLASVSLYAQTELHTQLLSLYKCGYINGVRLKVFHQ